MWHPIFVSTLCTSDERRHLCLCYNDYDRRYLLLRLATFVTVVTVAMIQVNHSAARNRDHGENAKNWIRSNRALRAVENRSDIYYNSSSSRSSRLLSSSDKFRQATLNPFQPIFNEQYSINKGATVLLSGTRRRQKWSSLLSRTSSTGTGVTNVSATFMSSNSSTAAFSSQVRRSKTRQRRESTPIDVRIRMLKPKPIRAANGINIKFRSSSPLFWKRTQRRRKGQLALRLKGSGVKIKKKKVSVKKVLKKDMAKQLKKKMLKMSKRIEKVLAKKKKSKKAKKQLFQSKIVKAVRSTVARAEKLCESITRVARRKIGSSRVKVQCHFTDAERLVRRFEKSQASRNIRKSSKAVSDVMMAVASHMRPLAHVLYRQTVARRRTVAILKRVRKNVAQVLHRLVRQAFGLRRALAATIQSNRKLSAQSKSVPPSSFAKTARKLYDSIDEMEIGKSKEGLIDTVTRVISVVAQVFHHAVEDLMKIYRLRQVTEGKLERAKDWCRTPAGRIGCLNVHVFRVLERMVERSSTLVRTLGRTLPKDPSTKMSRVPTAIRISPSLLKPSGGWLESEQKRASAATVARVIMAIAGNLRLIVRRLELAVIRDKLSRSEASKKLMKDLRKNTSYAKTEKTENKLIPKSLAPPTKPPPTTFPAAKPTANAKTARKLSGSVTLNSINRVMLSALRDLEKWSRLMYWQTAPNPDETKPEAMVVDRLPHTSVRQSAEQVALVITALTRRMRIIGQRAGKTVSKKLGLDVGEKSKESLPSAASAKTTTTMTQKTTPKTTAKPGVKEAKTTTSKKGKAGTESASKQQKGKKAKKKSKPKTKKAKTKKEKGGATKEKAGTKGASKQQKGKKAKKKSKPNTKKAKTKKEKGGATKEMAGTKGATKQQKEKMAKKKSKPETKKAKTKKEKGGPTKEKAGTKGASKQQKGKKVKNKEESKKKKVKTTKEKGRTSKEKAGTKGAPKQQKGNKPKKKGEPKTKPAKSKKVQVDTSKESAGNKDPAKQAKGKKTQKKLKKEKDDTKGKAKQQGSKQKPEVKATPPTTQQSKVIKDQVAAPTNQSLAKQGSKAPQKQPQQASDTVKKPAVAEPAISEPETEGHVIYREDMIDELRSQARLLARTLRAIISNVDKALTEGDENSEQYGIQSETNSEAKNIWIRFMNERLESADTPMQKSKTLEQMKQFSKRLLTKAEELEGSISSMAEDESDMGVMRSDRAADVSMETGHSRRSHGHRYRKRGRKPSYEDKMASKINMEQLSAQIGCGGSINFVKPSSVRSVVNGIKTLVDANSPTIAVEGLTSTSVEQGSNSDSAVEFEFLRSVNLTGIWLQKQPSTRRYLSINSTTIYVQLIGDRGTWLPVIDSRTRKPLILPVPSGPINLHLKFREAVTGLRLYPQSWTSKTPTIPRPLFIVCASSRHLLL